MRGPCRPGADAEPPRVGASLREVARRELSSHGRSPGPRAGLQTSPHPQALHRGASCLGGPCDSGSGLWDRQWQSCWPLPV